MFLCIFIHPKCHKHKRFVCMCVLSVVANGDVLNPAVRFLIPSRVIGQFERILEMITEKMGLRIVGGVRRYARFKNDE